MLWITLVSILHWTLPCPPFVSAALGILSHFLVPLLGLSQTQDVRGVAVSGRLPVFSPVSREPWPKVSLPWRSGLGPHFGKPS